MAVFRRKVRGKRLGTYSAKFIFHGQLYQRHGFPDRETAGHWIDTTRISLRRTIGEDDDGAGRLI